VEILCFHRNRYVCEGIYVWVRICGCTASIIQRLLRLPLLLMVLGVVPLHVYVLLIYSPACSPPLFRAELIFPIVSPACEIHVILHTWE
jgi:hypothetical protein